MGAAARALQGVVIAVLGACSASTKPEPQPSTAPAHWEYESKGDPEHWAQLDPRNDACKNGHYQSPIDLHAVARRLARPLTLDYRPDTLRIVNNGHTVQVQHRAGSTMTVDDRTYTLEQYHIHSPSEHTVEAHPFALEIHFVHSHPSGDLAVLAVLVEEGVEAGAEAQAIAKVWGHLPLHALEAFTGDESVDPRDLLPASLEHFQYHGSLTTPPCTETVDWSVLAQPLAMSRAHIAAFRRLYSANARPIQPRPDWCLVPKQHVPAG